MATKKENTVQEHKDIDALLEAINIAVETATTLNQDLKNSLGLPIWKKLLTEDALSVSDKDLKTIYIGFQKMASLGKASSNALEGLMNGLPTMSNRKEELMNIQEEAFTKRSSMLYKQLDKWTRELFMSDEDAIEIFEMVNDHMEARAKQRRLESAKVSELAEEASQSLKALLEKMESEMPSLKDKVSQVASKYSSDKNQKK